MEGWLVALGIISILWWWIAKTKRRNSDPEMKEIASVMYECIRGYFSLSEAARSERDQKLSEYLSSKMAQGAGLKELGHPVTMLTSILSNDEREHLIKITQNLYMFGGKNEHTNDVG